MKSADDFAQIPYAHEKGWPFGICKERSASALRRLADAIESCTVSLQSVELKSVATHDNFGTKSLTLVYSEIAARSDG